MSASNANASAMKELRALRPVDDTISLKYGAGGGAMRALIEQIFAADLPDVDGGVGLAAMDDGAVLPLGDGRWLVITTDSHVVHPRFFPGGDVGRLSVSGTVNDLAMMGATEPLALTCAVVLEAGFAREELERIWRSMRAACVEAGTTIVTGSVGDHGLAVMAARNELGLASELASDVAPINGLIRAALAAGGDGLVAMKDPTRGGLASSLHELAEKSGVGISVDEPAVPIKDAVRAVGELLGIDPLLVANEGKAVLGVRAEAVDRVLTALRAHPQGRDAALIGTCTDVRPGAVILDTGLGRRLLVEPEGELLPRIC
jgi:hydrogenase expression/formation protein HypE